MTTISSAPVQLQINDSNKNVPFIEIIESFLISNNKLYLSLSDKVQLNLVKNLSFISEITFQDELDDFIQNGNYDFSVFINQISSTLAKKYPVLHRFFESKVGSLTTHISKIQTHFCKDYHDIIKQFNFEDENLKIIDMDVSLGDGHNGESTTLILLSNGSKLIYKPRSQSITHAYNSFVNWVNIKLKTDLRTFKVLDYGEYGWLEFVKYEELDSEGSLQEYYYKAGLLLGITLLLGSKDYHYENIIVSGNNPTLIDHETIIQPFISNQSIKSWDEQHGVPLNSVLESLLIFNKDIGIPLNCIGYGISGNIEISDLEKKVINPNTINSKRVTGSIKRKVIEKNVPYYNGRYVFVNDYKNLFVDGFSDVYDLFLDSKKELKSTNSPIKSFKNREIRFVWRPTFVYFKILKYLRASSFMLSFEAYQSKLYELLSKAYKSEAMKEYLFILDFEMKQMLNGDIPIFSLNSEDNFLEGEKSLKIFEHNCMENINHRIDLLSPEHKKEQLEYILKWANM